MFERRGLIENLRGSSVARTLLRSVRLDPWGWGSPRDLKMTDKLNEGSAFVLQQLRLRLARMST